MATHCSTLAWKIPRTDERGRLRSMGLQRVRHDWATSLHFTHDFKFPKLGLKRYPTRTKWEHDTCVSRVTQKLLCKTNFDIHGLRNKDASRQLKAALRRWTHAILAQYLLLFKQKPNFYFFILCLLETGRRKPIYLRIKTITLKTKPQGAQGHGNNCTSRMRQQNLYLLLKKIGVDNGYKNNEILVT